jgi:hypothetical protein
VSAELRSILVGTVGLSAALIASAVLTISRGIPVSALSELNRVRRVAAMTIVLQCAHFTEELYTGFYKRFPEMLGLVPWPATFFLSFNIVWIAIWCLCVAFLRIQPRGLSFPIWLLAIASVANGIAHPLLSIVSGGYFPGLWTSPFAGAAGLFLFRALNRWTTQSSTLPGDT